MKAWEETWTATIWTHDSQQRPIWAIETDSDPPKAGELALPICEFEPDQEARAKLAAAAPEMARLLLALEWSATWPSGAPCCPSCNRTDPAADVKDPGHDPDCKWLATARSAGLR